MQLLTLVLDDFQDIELTTVLATLEKAKIFKKVDYYNSQGKSEILGQHQVVWIKTTVTKVNVEDYQAIFVPGGKAAQHLRNNPTALALVKAFQDQKKDIFAICDAPNALFEKGIIKDQKFASYPLDNQQQNLNGDVVVDQNLFSAKCAFNSFDLALLIIEKYRDQSTAKAVENSLKGII